jgi:hypothetical protein
MRRAMICIQCPIDVAGEASACTTDIPGDERRLREHALELFGERADIAQIEQAEIGSGRGLGRAISRNFSEKSMPST